MTDQDQLAIYLNDHFAAATAGVELVRRAAEQHDGQRGREIARRADDIAADRAALREIMRRLGVEESPVKAAAGWVGEKVGRLKPNGHLVSRAPLADVLELEGLRAGTAARIAGFQVLRAVAVKDTRLTKTEIEHLIERAEDQAQRLYTIHLQLAQENLAG